MFWGGTLALFAGVISFIVLGWIFYRYHDMYPWFGGLQPWLTGYYLLPAGLYLLLVRWMFVSGIFTYQFSWIDSILIVVLFIVLFGVSVVIYSYYKKLMVVAGRIEAGEVDSGGTE